MISAGILPPPFRSAARSILRPGGIPLSEYSFSHPEVIRTWRAVNRRHLTYSRPAQLSRLLHHLRWLERTDAAGEIIEAGCAYGGSAIVLCSAKRRSRAMRVFDVFGMIPPPSSRDGADMQARYRDIASGSSAGLGGGRYYAYDEDLEAKVTENFRDLGYPIQEHGVSLVAGKVQDTLRVDGPVCLAHIDVDWYEPVAACLERIIPHLVPGGVVALRAYADWSGCRTATDEYLQREDPESRAFTRQIVAGQLFLVKRT
jgi:O-methyltransferase